MDIDENLLEFFLQKAVENMFQNEPNIFKFTSQSGNTEWNLAHHLAIELHRLFPEFDCDVEIRKPNPISYTRPDIILHKRGNHDNNFLVIEAKVEDNPGRDKDFEKILEHYFIKPFGYKFGGVVNFSRDGVADTAVNIFPNT